MADETKNEGKRIRIRHRAKMTLEVELDRPEDIKTKVEQYEKTIQEELKKIPGAKVTALKLKLLEVSSSRPGGWNIIMPSVMGKETGDDD